jgi:N-acetyl-beta-hexosaminidase
MTVVKTAVSAAFALLAGVVFAELAVVPKPAQMRRLGGVYRGDKVIVERDSSIPEEGYRLSVAADGVKIVSSGAAGEIYARQTLAQLKADGGGYACVEISDAPKYKWRGLMLDDARHFFGKEVVKDFIDRMVEHKFNIFKISAKLNYFLI